MIDRLVLSTDTIAKRRTFGRRIGQPQGLGPDPVPEGVRGGHLQVVRLPFAGQNGDVQRREPAEDDRLRSEGLELQGLQRAFDPRDQRTVYVNIVSLTPLLTLSIDEPRSRTRTPSQLRSFHRYFAIIYMEAMEMFFLLSGNN